MLPFDKLRAGVFAPRNDKKEDKMVVVEIKISDELRKDLKTEIKDAILSSPLIKRLVSRTFEIGKEIKDARDSNGSLIKRLAAKI